MYVQLHLAFSLHRNETIFQDPKVFSVPTLYFESLRDERDFRAGSQFVSKRSRHTATDILLHRASLSSQHKAILFHI